MTAIPPSVADSLLHQDLEAAGLRRIHQGKVRDTYALPDENLLLPVATNRVSIFDFVLPALVPEKGELLTAMTVFWLTEVLTGMKHHLVAFGKQMDQYLPTSMRGRTELRQRALVVRRLSMVPIECIVRGCLTGTGWKSYREKGHVCGIALPPGLHDGSRLPEPIFTPTTKAKVGHDEHRQTADVIQQYGSWTQERSLEVYGQLASVAENQGFIFADTKLEFGMDGEEPVLADEVGTPDSSRFWDEKEWELANQQRKSPSPHDKQLLRNWGSGVRMSFLMDEGNGSPKPIVGLGNLKPENPIHVALVHSLYVPEPMLEETSRLYHGVLQRLTGRTLEGFQRSRLGVS